MPYKHGAYGDILGTKDYIPPSGVGTIPVYFGILPVHQLTDYSKAINKPLLVQSFNDAVKKCGYNDSNWTDFTLCEAIFAHFKNSIQPIGPIVLINVLDPDTHVKGTDTTATVAMTNGKGYINNDKVVLKTIALTGKVLGTDFSAEYTADGSKVLITDLAGNLGASLDLSFKELDITLITESVVIGGTNGTTGVKTGISVVDLVYPMLNIIPTLFCAPGWSEKKNVDTALKAAAQNINGHWFAFINSDLDVAEATNISTAKTQKTDNGYTSYLEAPCWPMAKSGAKKFHISTLATVTMQRVDFDNNNVPYETPSNKPVDVTGMCLANGSDIIFDQLQANDLNSKGIRTISNWGGRWVLWGGHTGDYEEGKEMDKRNVFDCSVRMLQYIANTFQSRYGILIDKPFNRAKVDTILNDFQEWFDNLISQGKLLYASVAFNETSNPISDIVEGDFIFDVETTTTPPGKSLTAKVSYTVSGINVLFGGE